MQVVSEKNPLRVLLVEDNQGDAILIQKAMATVMPSSYTVEHATNLEQALIVLEEQSFDVALLDRSLPDVEEFEGLLALQNMAPQLPIVFLTAYKDEQVAFQAIEQGAQDYLFKDNIDGHVVKRAVQYAILRKQFEGVLIMRANFDMLTGLANRVLFESRVDMALARKKRSRSNLSILFLDLDHFKQVNDTYGHAVGDQLLKGVAKRINLSLRPYDTAARFGGDEFAVLLESLPDVRHGEVVAQKIVDLFEEPFIIRDLSLHIGVSIGVATCGEHQQVSREALMKHADDAMYQAKKQHANSYCFECQDGIKSYL